jgi:hypothetical protein
VFKTRDIELKKTIEFIPTRVQYPKKNHTLFEIEGILNSATYLDLLVTKVGPGIGRSCKRKSGNLVPTRWRSRAFQLLTFKLDIF